MRVPFLSVKALLVFFLLSVSWVSSSAQTEFAITKGLPQDNYRNGSQINIHTQQQPLSLTLQIQFQDSIYAYIVYSTVDGNKQVLDEGVVKQKSFTISSPLEVSNPKEVVYSIKGKKKNNSWTDEYSSPKIKVWSAPEIVSENLSLNPYFYAGKKQKLSITAKGGYYEGWKFLWNNTQFNGQQNGDRFISDFEFSAVSTSLNVENRTLPISVDNNAGTNNWFHKNYSLPYQVAATPEVENDGKTVERHTLVGNKISIQPPSYKGGFPDTWTYNWDGNTVGNLNVLLDTPGTETHHWFWSNALPTDSVPSYTGQVNYNVVAWPTPVVSYVGNDIDTIFYDKTCKLEATVEGGYDEGWSFSWKEGTSAISSITSNGGKTSTFVFHPQNNQALETHTYSLHVKNVCEPENNSVWLSEEKKFSLTSVPSPRLPYNDSIVHALTGREVNIAFKTIGGYDKGWEFMWEYEGKIETTNTPSLSFTPANSPIGDFPIVHIIKVSASNKIKSETRSVGAMTITVYEWPEPSANMAEGMNDVYYRYEGNILQLGVTTAGGFADGWTYEWLDNGAVIPDAHSSVLTYSAPDVDNPEAHVVSCRVKNKAIGVSNDWYNKNIPFIVHVYATPKSEVQGVVRNVIDREAQHFSIIHHHGNDAGWSYHWTIEEDSQQSTSSTFSPILKYENGAVQHVSVSTWNKLPEAQDSVLVNSARFELHVWEKPVAGISEGLSDNYHLFENKTIHLSVFSSKGYSDGWSFEWSDNSSPIVDNSSKELVYEVPKVNGVNPQKHEIRCHVINQAEGVAGKWLDSTFVFTVNAYATPTSEILGLYNPMHVQEGEVLHVNVSHNYGYSNGWSYQWQILEDGSQTSTESVFQPSFNHQVGHIQHLKVSVWNKLPDAESPVMVLDEERTVYVWQTPVADYPEATPREFHHYQGEEQILSVFTDKGYLDGWNYTWFVNDTKVQGETSRSYNYVCPKNIDKDETYTIRCHVENAAPYRDAWFKKDFYYTIHVYPSPVSKIEGIYQTCLDGNSMSLEVVKDVGNTNGWTYNWVLDEDPTQVSTSKYFNPVFNIHAGTQQHVSITVYDKLPDASERKVIYEKKFDVAVYKQPEATKPANEPSKYYRYQGETVSAQIETFEGYPAGWDFEWFVDGNKVATAKSKVYQYTIPTTTVSTQHVVKCRVVNKAPDQPSNWYEHEFTFSVMAYALPKSEILGTYENVRDGEKLNLSVTHEGGDSNGWSYQWKLLEQDSQTSSKSSMTPVFNYYSGANQRIAVTVWNKLTDREARAVLRDTIKVSVWETANAAFPSSFATSHHLYEGESVSSKMVYGKGYPSGWKFEWLVDNKTIPNAESSDYTYYMPQVSSDRDQHEIICRVTNKAPDRSEYWFNQDFKFIVYGYSTPKSELQGVFANVMDGNKMPLLVTHVGGNKDGWSYEWSLEEDASQKSNTASMNPIFRYNAGAKQHVSVKVWNRLPDANNPKLIHQRSITVNVWKRPEASLANEPKYHMYEDEAIDLEMLSSNGYQSSSYDAWTYQWYVNGNIQPNATNQRFSYRIPMGVDQTTFKISCSIKNTAEDCPEDIVWYDKTLEYQLIGYSTPNVAETTERNDSLVIAEEPIHLGVSVRNGYPSGWHILWVGNDTPDLDSQESTFTPANPNTSPDAFVYQEVKAVAKNILPTPSINGERSFPITFRYKVWPKAKLPANLHAKGNGTSHILIADKPLESLVSGSIVDAKYHYRFFYEEANGNVMDVMTNDDNTERFAQYPDNAFAPGTKCWVQSYFYCEDAVNGGEIVMKPDGTPLISYSLSLSTDGTTRAETSIRSIRTEQNLYDSMLVRVYDLNGHILRYISVDGNTDVTEILQGLQSGIYIVEEQSAMNVSRYKVMK